MLGQGDNLREGYAEVGDIRLHYVEAGEGPLVLLLHGFPEFWYGWREQIEPLAAAGYRVVAPDTRGYNLSSKPDGVAAYDIEKLAGDIRDLIHERGADSAKFDRVERLPDASHWVHHDEHERVNQLLVDFFSPAR